MGGSSSVGPVTVPTFLGLAAMSFVLMEPVAYAVHRWVMHGPGRTLHRSHHRPPAGRLEANDLFPVAFASLAGVALTVGFNVPGYAWLVPVGTGVTLYGLAYGLVHDGIVHGRLPAIRRLSNPYLRALADAHRVHHLFGGEPYGMLAPLVPARLRSRAAAIDPQPVDRSRGSTPSQVPTLP
jgi:beta-carotene 3-hydroxylase